MLFQVVKNKENIQNNQNSGKTPSKRDTIRDKRNVETEGSLGFSAIEDLSTVHIHPELSPTDFANEDEPKYVDIEIKVIPNDNESLISVSSATDLDERMSDKTIVYESDRPIVSVSFGLDNCNKVDISTNKSNLKRVFVSTQNNDTTVECEVIEESQISTDSTLDENMNETILPNSLKKSAVAVNLEIKRKKLSDDKAENSKVLILNTDAIEKLSHVIIQPPNYKLVKRQTPQSNKIKSGVKRKSVTSPRKNGKAGDNLKQRTIEHYLPNKANVFSLLKVSGVRTVAEVDSNGDATVVRDVSQDMSKNSGVADVIKCERLGRGSCKSRNNESPRSAKQSSRRGSESSPRRQDIKISSSDAPRVPSRESPRSKNGSISSHSPRKNVESLQFSLPPKSKSTKTSTVSTRNIPHHKIVAGML